ncbi:M61 family metallopeptidase [Shewanella sp. NIFS-20-20]|uniref:M61 family metallopeptidase n=1 Tax=Shewanella sp. NIFS-20-20 TaxID=2853806 RepID=UPI001C47AE51|nr:PDZ domain-containing protein [Shewanella sp. NIFS-20-20]MBV7317091.1 PDZ domain-containing protein [Shewanella sp. NIFS-20-20]
MPHYHINANQYSAHLFDVSIHVTAVQPQQTFCLPAWIPGSYMIRDFARHLINMRATNEQGQAVRLIQLDKQRWQVVDECEQLHLHYQIYAADLSVRSAYLDHERGFFNGSSVFVCFEGLEHQAHHVLVSGPHDWLVATGLSRLSGNKWHYGEFVADNYDALIDHPFELGAFAHHSFDVDGVNHDIVLAGRLPPSLRQDPSPCLERLANDLTAICRSQIQLFDKQAPFDNYLFMTAVLDNGFGGLEHRNSTALMCSRSDLPLNQTQAITDGYQTYLSLCSHEYFHSWNVKRIKPTTFVPYQLNQESYTEQLWAYEGITSYYDDLMTYRSGLISQQQYLAQLAQTLTRVYRSQGRFKQSLTESSFNAWTKFYQQDENAQNAIVSYYTKGALFALYIDLHLREHSNYSLDDLMRLLWRHHGLTGVGTDDRSHQAYVSQLLGQDASALFAYLNNTQDIPLAALLANVGVKMHLRAKASTKDIGGEDLTPWTWDFGAQFKPDNAGLIITSVRQDSPAMAAGLSANDVLIAADGLKVSADFMEKLQSYPQGQALRLHYFRRDQLLSGNMPLQTPPADTVYFTISDPKKLAKWL